MQNLINKINDFFSNIDALASLFFRCGIGIAFIIHGLDKFPLPPQGLIEYFGLSPMLASTVALSELLTGLILIISVVISVSSMSFGSGHLVTGLETSSCDDIGAF